MPAIHIIVVVVSPTTLPAPPAFDAATMKKAYEAKLPREPRARLAELQRVPRREIDVAHAVGEAFHRSDDAVEPRPAIDVEHLHQVQPERLGDQEQGADVKRQLGPGIEIVHDKPGLEFLRGEHRDDKVDETGHGDQADDDVFHG